MSKKPKNPANPSGIATQTETEATPAPIPAPESVAVTEAAGADSQFMAISSAHATMPEVSDVLTRKEQTKLEKWIAVIKPKADKVLENSANVRASIMDLGGSLSMAKAELSEKGQIGKDYETLIATCGLHSVSNADNYIRTAMSDELKNPDIAPHLPIRVGALIDLAAWHEDDLRQAIEQGILHPNATRSELRHWRNRDKSKPNKEPEHPLSMLYHVGIRITGQMSAEQHRDLDAELARLTRMFPIALDKPVAPEARYLQRVMDRIRSSARHMVEDYKQGVRKRQKRPSFRKPFQKWWYPLSSDEMDIPADASEEIIRTVLGNIGRPDEYERIRDEAFTAVKPPKGHSAPETPEQKAEGLAELQRQLAALKERPDISGQTAEWQ